LATRSAPPEQSVPPALPQVVAATAPTAESPSPPPASADIPKAESPEPTTAASAAEPTTPEAEADTGDTITVFINIQPEGSRLTLKGKEIGRTPFTLELPRGERRVLEVVNKGYYPRRLVIDGSRTEISYGLKPEDQ